jgi:hypothetical protein
MVRAALNLDSSCTVVRLIQSADLRFESAYLAGHCDSCQQRANAASEQENSKCNPNTHTRNCLCLDVVDNGNARLVLKTEQVVVSSKAGSSS